MNRKTPIQNRHGQKSKVKRIVFQAFVPFEMVRQSAEEGVSTPVASPKGRRCANKSAQPPNALAPHEELPLAQRKANGMATLGDAALTLRASLRTRVRLVESVTH
ncbi:hypothetical protein [Nostoc sp. ChiQUE01b]|uniref:hypothetical protein n=1 Tax=Nostoc sp. ChiQUE01b TaxID=3075376 RepID=UPI002AD2AF6D|nr:hypothetical protein [Nostoc sp. ChiQUE01b]MDZ8263274.1 hypothetical protein [Nostoc sp. ChiQUE01b]